MRLPDSHPFTGWQAMGLVGFRARALVYVLCATFVLAALLVRVMLRTTWVRRGYELSAEQQEHQRLLAELQTLKTEYAARRSPDRLLREGKARFLLSPARPEQIITVSP